MDFHALAQRFEARFGRAPRLFRAPGRINIIGEHTDHCEGLVMPAAIDRWCAVAAAPNGGRRMNVVSGTLDREATIDLEALSRRGDWSDYIAGIAWSLGEAGVPVAGADLWIESDVPVGAGLSSSAALEVAVALALIKLAGGEADGPRIAQWARRAENEFVGVPCGIMDQFSSANGRAGHAIVLDCRTLESTFVRLPADVRFLVIDSMVRHVHSDGAYRARREDCDTAARLLDVRALRDVAVADLPHALDRLPEGPAKRCRHVVTENARVGRAAAALDSGDTEALGRLMNASHDSLRDDMEVSIEALDRLVAIAQVTPGVLGARMMGGGFGGCIIALVRADAEPHARPAIQAVYSRIAGATPPAFPVHAVDGAHEVFP